LYTINERNNYKKNKMIRKILENAKTYVGREINNAGRDKEENWWVGESWEEKPNPQISDKLIERTTTMMATEKRNKNINQELNSAFMRSYYGYCITKFNQVHRIELAMNHKWLYEIVDGVINNRLNLSKVRQVIIKHKFLSVVGIKYQDGFFNSYILSELDIECFVMRVSQIIEFAPEGWFSGPEGDQFLDESDSSTFVKMRSIQSRFHNDAKRILGMHRADSARELESAILDKIPKSSKREDLGELFSQLFENCPFNNDLSPDRTL
jgi:hypothetical protein